ncbi:asteroid-like protein 1 [Moniliophthora roreri]|nr:asteroid-like protein 1 [Moniliophthora roreri]
MVIVDGPKCIVPVEFPFSIHHIFFLLYQYKSPHASSRLLLMDSYVVMLTVDRYEIEIVKMYIIAHEESFPLRQDDLQFEHTVMSCRKNLPLLLVVFSGQVQ